jgi:hypothetical protein
LIGSVQPENVDHVVVAVSDTTILTPVNHDPAVSESMLVPLGSGSYLQAGQRPSALFPSEIKNRYLAAPVEQIGNDTLSGSCAIALG